MYGIIGKQKGIKMIKDDKEYDEKIARLSQIVRVDVLSDEEIAELDELVDEIIEFEDKQIDAN